jgi:hypothetical protein
LDGRTVGARRARELAQSFEAELGGTVTSAQRAAIERAATLMALAEDAQARRLAGDPSVSLEDLVRIDNAAMRAVRQLGIKPGAKPAAPSSPAEYLARRAAERAGKASSAPPLSSPSSAESRHRPNTDDGEASGQEGAE